MPEATARKVAWVREAAGERFDSLELEIGAYFAAIGDGWEAACEGMGRVFGLEKQELCSHPHALFGSVDAVCEELIRRREVTGIHYITVGDDVMDAFAPVVARLAGT